MNLNNKRKCVAEYDHIIYINPYFREGEEHKIQGS